MPLSVASGASARPPRAGQGGGRLVAPGPASLTGILAGHCPATRSAATSGSRGPEPSWACGLSRKQIRLRVSRLDSEFDRPLSQDTFAKISGLHGQVRRDLPRKLEQQAVTFSMASLPVLSPAPISTLAGVTFDSLKRDGNTERALSASQKAITYMVANYSRWREFWPVAARMLRVVGEPAISDTPLKAFVLTAQNRFVWDGKGQPPDLALLVKPDTKFAAANMLIPHDGSRHNFHGYLERTESPRGARIVNINLVILQTPDGRWICDMVFPLRLILDDAISAAVTLFEPQHDEKSALERRLHSLHDLNKALLRDILVSSFVAKIEGLAV